MDIFIRARGSISPATKLRNAGTTLDESRRNYHLPAKMYWKWYRMTVRTSDFLIQRQRKTFSTLPSPLFSYTPSPSLLGPLPSPFSNFLSSIARIPSSILSSFSHFRSLMPPLALTHSRPQSFPPRITYIQLMRMGNGSYIETCDECLES
ncbi:hypothetical protein F5051DRAFT_28896 [Lentinula edodes]|nr:hypothetical protein F5051DRAFT_28896 [Lentinula edodes]